MKIRKFKTHEILSQFSVQEILKYLKQNKGCLICFAGGDTPVRTLKLLVESHSSGEIDLRDYYYVELDEWIGLSKEDKGSCASYLYQNLFLPAGIPDNRIHLFNTKNTNLIQECQFANDYIMKFDQIGLALLGVGVNGHIGFNEPSSQLLEKAHVVDLSASTQLIGKKYFDTLETPKQGITIGLGQLLKADKIIIQASGRSKQAVVRELIESEKPNSYLPISYFNACSQADFMVDEEALSNV